MNSNFIDKVFAFTREKGLFSAPSHVLVGLSGGADSMALLVALLHWPEEGLQVSAVHVHHGLRGDCADRDEAFVRNYCQQQNVPLTVFHENVSAYAKEKGFTFEEAGRSIRYARFEEVRESIGADCIVTAHTASDQAETLLMRIVRGTGVDGLCGIRAKTGLLCRPLLSCSRVEVEQFCAEHQIPYVNDETNGDLSYTRNRIRHQVLPLLRELNPSVDAALLRLNDCARADAAPLWEQANATLKNAETEHGYEVSSFSSAPAAVRRRMIVAMLRESGVTSFVEPHILAAEKALLSGVGQVKLTDGFVLLVSQGTVTVRSNDPVSAPEPVALISVPATVAFGEVYCRLTREENVHNLFSNTALDYDTIQGNLYLRCRREGDTIHPAGRGVGKSIKKLMNECHIPAYLRDSYPLLCDDLGVVMVPGYAVDERVRITDTTKDYLVCACEKSTH